MSARMAGTSEVFLTQSSRVKNKVKDILMEQKGALATLHCSSAGRWAAFIVLKDA